MDFLPYLTSFAYLGLVLWLSARLPPGTPHAGLVGLYWANVASCALGLLVCLAQHWSLRDPLAGTGWLLAGGGLAGGLAGGRQLGPGGSRWARWHAWGLGLASPVLVAYALSLRVDIVSQTSEQTVTKQTIDTQTFGSPHESHAQWTTYQARWGLFEQQTGQHPYRE